MTQDEREAMRTVLRENIGKLIRDLLVAPLEDACKERPTSEIDRELLEIGREVLADLTGQVVEPSLIKGGPHL
jgi:hypothetical protein